MEIWRTRNNIGIRTTRIYPKVSRPLRILLMFFIPFPKYMFLVMAIGQGIGIQGMVFCLQTERVMIIQCREVTLIRLHTLVRS